MCRGRTIERAHREIHVMAEHIVVDPMWVEQAGRLRLGLGPTSPLFSLSLWVSRVSERTQW